MALSESLLLLTGICFWKNTYVFPRKHVRVLNPAKRNVMVVKNEMRLLKQKRNVLQI